MNARWLGAATVVVACGVFGATPALAQRAQDNTIGVRVGISGDPNQFYFGLHAETGPIFDRVYFRPNVELGFGDNERLLALNFEFAYRRPLRGHPWSLYLGGGPAANIHMRNNGGGNDVRGGLNLLLGVQHSQGFFTELKVGVVDSPSIKFGVGFAFK